MTGSAAFYQVAVALVPGLLFGAASLELREKRFYGLDGRPKLWLKLLVAVILLIGVAAEAIAIRGAIEPEISAGQQRFLAFALILGTVGFALWIATPLLSLAPVWVVVVIIVAGVAGTYVIIESLGRAEARAAHDDALKRKLKAFRQLHEAEVADFTARANLITVTRTVRRSDSVLPMVLAQLRRLEADGMGAVRNGLNHGNMTWRLNRAYAVLKTVERRLRRALEGDADGLGTAERELLLLATLRTIAAASMRVNSVVDSAMAVQDVEKICASASFLPCSGGADE